MNKNDFRLQFPLWNALFYFGLMLYAYPVIYAIDLLQNDFQQITQEDGSLAINYLPLIIFIVATILFMGLFFIYILKMIQYNKLNPNHKKKWFTSIHLIEFVDDDEMMQQVTNAATRKIYTFYSNVIPVFIFLLFLPLHRYIYIVAICSVLIIQQFIYYRHLVQYADGLTEKKVPLFTSKIVAITTVVLFVVTLSSFGFFYKLNESQKMDREIMYDCIDANGTVYFHGTLFNSISCEK